MHRTLFLLAGLLAPLLLAGAAAAQSFTVAPPRLVLTDAQPAGSIAVINSGNRELRIRAEWVFKRMDESGGLVDGELSEVSADKIVRFSPRAFTVPGNATQRVRLQLRPPAGTPPGEYRAHLLLRPETPEEAAPTEEIAAVEREPNERVAGMQVATVISFAVPIIARVGEGTTALSLSDARLEPGTDGGWIVRARLTRSGPFSGYGDLRVYAGDALVGELRGIAIYHDLAARDVAVGGADPIGGGPLTLRYVEHAESASATEVVLAEASVRR